MLIYLKGLEDEIEILPPTELGGLKSSEYCALNPQGKMPLMVLPDGSSIPESECILQYLADKYADREPTQLIPSTPELRVKSQIATRFHDMYITTIQMAMYREMDIEIRAEMIKSISEQLDVLEDILVGPYCIGHYMSTADCALFPTFVFMNFILPKYFGWESIWLRRPKLEAWWNQMCSETVPARVKDEIEGGLRGWEEKDRWNVLGIVDQVKDKSYKWAY